MNPFKTDAGKKLDRDLATARSARDKLAERLSAAETVVTERRAEAQRLARAGAADADLDVAEAALRAAEDRVATLIGAKAEIDGMVASLEEAVAQAADRQLRAKTAAEIEKLPQSVEEAAIKFDAGAAVLIETTARAALCIPDAMGLQLFATSARATKCPQR